MKRFLILGFVAAQCQIGFPQSIPHLINYQGRLTGQNGDALPTGSYGIEFRLWDSFTNTTGLIWGQQQNVSVQANGVFHVILGAAGGSTLANPVPAVNDLGFAFGEATRFLGVTVVATNGSPVAGASEILPRQQLLSVPFAVNAGIAATVAPGAISSPQIAPGSIQNPNLGTNIVALTNLISRVISNNAPVGGVAISGAVSFSTNAMSPALVDVPGLSVSLETSGRPVLVGLIPDTPAQPITNPVDFSGKGEASFLGATNAPGYQSTLLCAFAIARNGTNILSIDRVSAGYIYQQGYPPEITIPAGSLRTLDFNATPGTVTYSVKVSSTDVRVWAVLYKVRLVAYEL